MTFKDFFFWAITWSLIATLGFCILLFSLKILGNSLSGDICALLALLSWVGSSIFVQPKLKKMFGYSTGLDKK